LPRAVVLLRAAGRIVSKPAMKVVGTVARFADKRPLESIVVGLAIFAYANPDSAEALLSSAVARVGQVVTGVGEETARVAAGLPGKLLATVWDDFQAMAQKDPMLTPVYYIWFLLIVFMAVALPVYALRSFLRPVYDFLASLLRPIIRRLQPETRRQSAKNSP
jgi:hypothetical protein